MNTEYDTLPIFLVDRRYCERRRNVFFPNNTYFFSKGCCLDLKNDFAEKSVPENALSPMPKEADVMMFFFSCCRASSLTNQLAREKSCGNEKVPPLTHHSTGVD